MPIKDMAQNSGANSILIVFIAPPSSFPCRIFDYELIPFMVTLKEVKQVMRGVGARIAR